MSLNDHELMSQIRAGDSGAFERLVRRWESRVSRVLRRLVRDTDVEDVRQEVFIRVLLGAKGYRPEAEFSSWLYRIVLNLARDVARKRSLRMVPLADHQPASGNGSVHQESERRELASKVLDSLTSLPANQRELVVLKHFGELSFSQIAEVVGAPVSTIKSRTAAALKRLAVELQKRGIHRVELER